MIKTLDQVEPGRKVRVVQLAGGHRFIDRLAGMGIGVGCELEVWQQSYGRGGLLVTRGQSRLAIGRKMAGKIVVEPMEYKP